MEIVMLPVVLYMVLVLLVGVFMWVRRKLGEVRTLLIRRSR